MAARHTLIFMLLLLTAACATAGTRLAHKPPGWWWENIYKTTIGTPGSCGSFASEPTLGNIGSAPPCQLNYTLGDLTNARVVRYGGEYHTPVTETKDPAIEAHAQAAFLHGAGGSAMVLNRDDVNPPACPGSPPARSCFTYADAVPVGAGVTCVFPNSTDATARGLKTGSAINLLRQRTLDAQNAMRPPGGANSVAILSLRFDLLHWSVLQIAGFSNDWLAASSTPWSTFNTFVTNGGAVWSWSENANSSAFRDHDEGIRYKDIIEARGGNPEDYAYYLTRPSSPGNDDYLWANGAMVRTDLSAYQDWYIDHVVIPMMRESGATYYELANKQPQHTGNWSCTNRYANYANMLAAADGCFTGDVSPAWTCHAYATGQRQLAAKLIARGIPYASMTVGKEVYTTTHWLNCTGDSNCQNTDNEPEGGTCAQDDYRWVLARASFIEFVSDFTSAGAAFLSWNSTRNIPYVEWNDEAEHEAVDATGCPALP